jgi:anthranilate phosphoribosyltransferase
VHGQDGLDEVTTTSRTFISEVKGGKFSDYEIAPEDFGFKRAKLEDLAGGDIRDNKCIALDVLGGKKGSARDIVLLNSGCAIYAADRARSIKEGIELAVKSIDSGGALKKLELLKEYSNVN